MIIATKKKQELDQVINNTYLIDKLELDQFVYNTRTYETINVLDDFIVSEFIEKGESFSNYTAMVREFRPNLIIKSTYEDKQSVKDIEYIMGNIRNPKELALHVIRNRTMYDKLKHCSAILNDMEHSITLKDSTIAGLNIDINNLRTENETLKKNLRNMTINFQEVSSRLNSVNDLNFKINVDNYRFIFYIKLNEQCMHSYSLVSAIRNKLSMMSVSSSILALLPIASNLEYDKWSIRGFVDIREPIVEDLVDADRVVTDLFHVETMKTFLQNQRQSQVLIIFDKTISTYMPFVGKNFIMMDVGRNYLKNFIHYGKINEINMDNMNIVDMLGFYTDNEAVNSLFSVLK